jgi:hypothetical protein
MARFKTVSKSSGVHKRKGTTHKKPAKRSSSLRHKRVFGLRLHHVGGLALLIIGTVWGLTVFASQPPATGNAASCTPDTKMVNPCRPWLSAAVGGYETGGKTQLQFFNQRLNDANALANPGAKTTISYKMDMPHVYHSPGQNLFSNYAKETLNDSSLYGHSSQPILINWKPGGSNWAATASGDSDSSIVTAAQNAKALGSRKIMLTLWHEPENDNVNAVGVNITGNCKAPTGTNGSAADYRAMWKRVRQVFDQQGVKNVVWAWNPMGFVGSDSKSGWACIEDALYPGNDLVDWIIWDPYSSSGGAGSFYESINRFYRFLQDHDNNGSHDYSSKPWGVAEHGSNTPQANAIAYYQDGIKTLGTNWSENKFPNIKLYSIFDTSVNGGTNGGLRVGYNDQGTIDTKEQAAYNAFAQHILNFGNGVPAPAPTPPKPTKDTIPPIVTLVEPVDGSTKSGTIAVRGLAADNVKVKAVTLRVNDKWVETDETAPYEFKLDTRKYPNGRHNIVLRGWDPTNNMAQSATITVTFKNGSGAGTHIPPRPSTTVISGSTNSSKPLTATSFIIVSPTVAGNSVRVWVNNKLQDANTIDTTALTNGTHTVKVEENGVISSRLVSVNNPPLLAILNEARANTVLYVVGFIVIFGSLATWYGRSYVTGIMSRKEARIVRAQRRIK